MAHVNILSTDLTLATDTLALKADVAVTASNNGSAFSDVMSHHQRSKGGNARQNDGKIESVDSQVQQTKVVDKVANSQTELQQSSLNATKSVSDESLLSPKVAKFQADKTPSSHTFNQTTNRKMGLHSEKNPDSQLKHSDDGLSQQTFDYKADEVPSQLSLKKEMSAQQLLAWLAASEETSTFRQKNTASALVEIGESDRALLENIQGVKLSNDTTDTDNLTHLAAKLLSKQANSEQATVEQTKKANQPAILTIPEQQVFEALDGEKSTTEIDVIKSIEVDKVNSSSIQPGQKRATTLPIDVGVLKQFVNVDSTVNSTVNTAVNTAVNSTVNTAVNSTVNTAVNTHLNASTSLASNGLESKHGDIAKKLSQTFQSDSGNMGKTANTSQFLEAHKSVNSVQSLEPVKSEDIGNTLRVNKTIDKNQLTQASTSLEESSSSKMVTKKVVTDTVSGISQVNNTLGKEIKLMDNALAVSNNQSANQSLVPPLSKPTLAKVLQPVKSNNGLANQATGQVQQNSSLESALPSASPVTISTVNDSNHFSQINSTIANTINNTLAAKTAVETHLSQNQADSQDSKEQSEKQNQQTLYKEQQSTSASQLASVKETVLSTTPSVPDLVEKSLDKTNDKAVAHIVSDNSRLKSSTAEQEFAINQLLTKTSVDNISSQSVNNEVKLSQEIMSVYRKDFTHSVKEKVMVMINQKINQLEIRLDPAELGSMHVKVNLQSEQAVVSFMVQNTQTKEVLEQNIGKLKEMLANSGIDVGESNIEQQDNSGDEQAEFSQQQQTKDHDQVGAAGEESAQLANNLYKASSTGIDYFA